MVQFNRLFQYNFGDVPIDNKKNKLIDDRNNIFFYSEFGIVIKVDGFLWKS